MLYSIQWPWPKFSSSNFQLTSVGRKKASITILIRYEIRYLSSYGDMEHIRGRDWRFTPEWDLTMSALYPSLSDSKTWITSGGRDWRIIPKSDLTMSALCPSLSMLMLLGLWYKPTTTGLTPSINGVSGRYATSAGLTMWQMSKFDAAPHKSPWALPLSCVALACSVMSRDWTGCPTYQECSVTRYCATGNVRRADHAQHGSPR